MNSSVRKFEFWVLDQVEAEAEKNIRGTGGPYTSSVAKRIEDYVHSVEVKKMRNGNTIAVINRDVVMYAMDAEGNVYDVPNEIRRSLSPLQSYYKVGHIDDLDK